MKKTVYSRGTCVILFVLVAALIAAGGQAQQVQKIDKSIVKAPLLNPPTINSISQDFQPMAVHLVLNGANFPTKYAGNNVARLIRLVPVAGSGEYFIGQTGNWTPTVLDDTVGLAIPTGRWYRIGIVEFQETPTGINNKKLISNEVQFLVKMNLDHATPSSAPAGGEVEVTTANDLGPQGAKTVKLNDMTCEVTQWLAPNGIFKFRLPSKIAQGTYNLYVEEISDLVSKRIPFTVTGGKR